MRTAAPAEADRRRVPRASRRAKVMWAVWMSGGGIASAVIVYLLTDSLGWALVALLASGVVLNMLAQIVVQPFRAVSATGRRAARHARR